jgi:hypothetical protein
MSDSMYSMGMSVPATPSKLATRSWKSIPFKYDVRVDGNLSLRCSTSKSNASLGYVILLHSLGLILPKKGAAT